MRYVTGKNFLRSPLLPRQVYFRSVGNDRCLMTGLSVGSVMFSSGIKPALSAVPIYTQESREKDTLLRSPRNCPYEVGRLRNRCNKEPDPYLEWPKYEAFVFECLGIKSDLFKEPGSFEKAESMYIEVGGKVPQMSYGNVYDVCMCCVLCCMCVSCTKMLSWGRGRG
ncbi:unnamed protein product [Strongylus vulgaris]|uniref:Uncharacterized protein n=1 Tax=Strongylus vulgaris TaxID=40348 RepID=A0A3P7IMH0_STRVU|nr:unnamed protein product [Strongylus vulgaris]